MDDQLYAICLIEEGQYYVHGGTNDSRRHCLDVLFSGASLAAAQRAASLATGTVRVAVEWMYKKVKLYWTTSDFKRKMKTGESPVALLDLVSMLLTNVRTWSYRKNTVSRYFECDPLTLDSYLHHKDQKSSICFAEVPPP